MEQSYVKHLNNSLNYYANNNYIAGISMLILNIGTKYIFMDLSKQQDDLLKTIFFRRLSIFTIFWIGTKDIYHSCVLTLLYIIFIVHLFNENSKFYIFKKFRNPR